jgi:hypothetical protein
MTNLQQRLSEASDGDVIDLGGDTLPFQRLAGLSFVEPVTIANGSLSGLMVSDCAGLIFLDVHMVADPTELYGYRFSGCERIRIDRCRAQSDDTLPVDQQRVTLVFFDGCSDVAVERSDFSHAWHGIEHRRTTRITISDNRFHHLRTDGIRGGGMIDGLIEGNEFRDFFGAGVIGTSGDHCDAIQFWTTERTGRSSNVTIRRNAIRRGAGRLLQGMLLDGIDGLTVDDNLAIGTMWNGILIAGCTGASVTRNKVLGDQGQPSRLRVVSMDAVAEMTGNIAEFELPKGAEVPGANEIVGLLSTDDLSRIEADWLAPDQPQLPPQDSLDAIKSELRELLPKVTAVLARLEAL